MVGRNNGVPEVDCLHSDVHNAPPYTSHPRSLQNADFAYSALHLILRSILAHADPGGFEGDKPRAVARVCGKMPRTCKGHESRCGKLDSTCSFP